MEATFANLQTNGQNNVDGLVKWLKDSTGSQSKEQEDKIRGFFSDVTDQNNVTLEEFKGVVNKVAEEFKTNSDGIVKKLTESGPKLLQDAVDGAASTVTNAVKDLVPKF